MGKRPVYVPPQGLSVDDVEEDMNALNHAESNRRTALNAQLRAILDGLRANFADKLAALKKAVSADAGGELADRLATAQSNQAELANLANELPAVEAAEKACDAANIEENEKTDHTYDDLWFAHNLLTKTYKRNVDLLNNQIQASKTEDISPEQVEEFKETFKHFDQDQDEELSKLEFKSCLSGLGVVELDFQKFLKYMISITKDEESPEQIEDSFNVLAGGKDHVTENDMKVGQLSAEQIAHLKSVLPEKDGISGGYDYKAYIQNLFN